MLHLITLFQFSWLFTDYKKLAKTSFVAEKIPIILHNTTFNKISNTFFISQKLFQNTCLAYRNIQESLTKFLDLLQASESFNFFKLLRTKRNYEKLSSSREKNIQKTGATLITEKF